MNEREDDTAEDQAPPREKNLTAEDQAPPRAKNLLEWMSARGVPDSIKAVVVGLLLAITITPYFGGRTFWSFGSTQFQVPTISPLLFWPSVVLPPFVWMAVFAPLSLARASRVAVAFGISILLVVVLQQHPRIALDSMTPNSSFVWTRQKGFQAVGYTWNASHRDGQFCHFRTPAYNLDIGEGCAFRVDKISIESGGRADVATRDGLAGFDLEVFVSTRSLLNETKTKIDNAITECVAAKDFKQIKEKPKKPEARGHTVIYVQQTTLPVRYEATFDFLTQSITAVPIKGPITQLKSGDIDVGKDGARVQLSVWTAWGLRDDEVLFQLEDLAITVSGRLHCGIKQWLQQLLRDQDQQTGGQAGDPDDGDDE